MGSRSQSLPNEGSEISNISEGMEEQQDCLKDMRIQKIGDIPGDGL